MYRKYLSAAVACSALALILGAAPRSEVTLAPVDAVTKARDDVEIKFTIGGLVTKVHVKRGDHVEKGQKLIELEDLENKALIEFYRTQADSNLGVQARQADLELKKIEERATKQLVEKGSGTAIELDRAQVNRKIAALNVDAAELQRTLDGHRLAQYKAAHARYTRRAPWAGVIDNISISEGDTVEPLAPVGRLVVVDPLLIDAPVETRNVNQLKVGSPAWVRLKKTDGSQAIQGTINFIAQVADAASDTTLVGIEVSNPRYLKPGRHVTVSFSAPAGMASATSEEE